MSSMSHTLGWTFTILLCFKLFCGVWGDCGPPPVIPNTNPVEETSGTHGQTVLYTCDRSTNYYEIPNKSSTITCQSDDTWTTIDEFCIRGCGFPDRLSFAEPRQDFVDQSVYPPLTTVTYSCRPGYIRVPGRRNSITCLANYTWSIPEIFCQRKSCGNPGEVENGDMEAIDFLFGSRVTYTCNEGFRLLSKRNTRECLADGTWSNVLPQCDAVICAAPNMPVNGSYNPQKDEYTYLDSVTFSCLKPLEVVGSSSISCTANGEWTSDSPTCKAVNCPEPPPVEQLEKVSGFAGPYTLNSAISFKCKGNYVLKGSSSIICNIDSQWSAALPKCELVTCGKLDDIPNGRVLAPSDNVGSTATYTCNKGYVLTSTDSRKCQENGIWSGSAPACEGKCDPPPMLPFATIIRNQNVYVNGTVVHYECKKGFINNPGKEKTLTCRGHSWSVHDDFCTRRSCGDPGKIMNGHVSVQDNLFGSRATYFCEEGYMRNTTQDYRECQEDGRWSNPIECKEVPKSDGLSTGAKIGIACGVCAIVLAGASVLIYKIINKNKKEGVYYCDVNPGKCAAAVEQEL